jgi:DNA gyrase inhibitor GyrI
MRTVLIVLGASLALGLAALWNFGAFSTVTVSERTMPRATIVYAKHIGDYGKIRSVIDSTYLTLLTKGKIASPRGFGLYYDNPREAPQEKLRSLGGCMVDSQDESRADSLKTRGYKTAHLPPAKAVYAEFPYKGPLSILIGVVKVYPRMMKYASERKIDPRPVMEIYDLSRRRIEYVMAYEIPMAAYLDLLR